MSVRLALLSLAVSVACAASEDAAGGRPAPAPPAAAAYVIRGEERPNWSPGWRAVLFGDRFLLDSPTSAGWYAVDLPAPRVEGATRTFTAPRLALVVEENACALAVYREALPDRITLDWDSGRFQGCGGPRPRSSGLAGTTWELLRMGAEPAPPGGTPPAVVHFAPDGGVYGTEACNDTGGSVRWTARGFQPMPDEHRVMTAMGCGDQRAVAFGSRFWNRLARARSWRREGDSLFIAFDDGGEAELRFLL